ncbi:MAG: hypothetical protein OXE95_12740 [Chloroflexi bacterium]|nr:hypothetical protein [Chloroflexota bacterium]MCY4248428.1 hypothetical protein [Chloroflexota bacterium]
MSRIHFEWEVEADIIDQPDGEDPQGRRNRQRDLRRALLLIALLAVAFILGGLALHLRIVQARNEIAQQLTDTIKVEAAALRIGDRSAFLQIQSGDDAWLAAQSTLFERYQTLKAENAIELSGDILSLAIAGERARALVREDRHGLPYARLSFYARADRVWRHIPPDFTFWGDPQRYEAERVVVQYREADAPFAEQMGADLAKWVAEQCAATACDADAKLHIEVAPEAEKSLTWVDASAGILALRSPYLGIVRADKPFDSERATPLYQLLSERWSFDS